MPTPQGSRNSHFMDAMRGMGRTVVNAAIIGGDADTPLTPVTGFAAALLSGGNVFDPNSLVVRLSWTGSVVDDQFEIQRKTGVGGTYLPVAFWSRQASFSPGAPGSNGVYYDSWSLAEQTQYYYRIRRVRGDRVSTWSADVNVTTFIDKIIPIAAANVRLLSQADPNNNALTNSGKLKAQSNVLDLSDPTSNGFKTVVKLPAAMPVAVFGQMRLDWGTLASIGGQLGFSSGVASSRLALNLYIRPIIADFDIAVCSWANQPFVFDGAISNSSVHRIAAAEVSNTGEVSPHKIRTNLAATSTQDVGGGSSRGLRLCVRMTPTFAGATHVYGFLASAHISEFAVAPAIINLILARIESLETPTLYGIDVLA